MKGLATRLLPAGRLQSGRRSLVILAGEGLQHLDTALYELRAFTRKSGPAAMTAGRVS
jgi:hypothetical protein